MQDWAKHATKAGQEALRALLHECGGADPRIYLLSDFSLRFPIPGKQRRAEHLQ